MRDQSRLYAQIKAGAYDVSCLAYSCDNVEQLAALRVGMTVWMSLECRYGSAFEGSPLMRRCLLTNSTVLLSVFGPWSIPRQRCAPATKKILSSSCSGAGDCREGVAGEGLET